MSDLLSTPTMEANRRPNVMPVKFWTDYVPDPEKPGKFKARDMVRWAKRGDLTSSAMDEAIDRLRKPMTETDDTGNALENPVWTAVKEAHARWKAGEELPENGTALEAWPGVDKGQVTALKHSHIRTVEDLAALPDRDIDKIKLPDARKLRDLAKAFVANMGGAEQMSVLMNKRDSEAEALRMQVAEQKEEVAELRRMLLESQNIPAETRSRETDEQQRKPMPALRGDQGNAHPQGKR
jgi:ATP-dependent helicase/DNAse subunit B